MTNKTKGLLLLASIPIQIFFWTGVGIELGFANKLYETAACASGFVTCFSSFIFAVYHFDRGEK